LSRLVVSLGLRIDDSNKCIQKQAIEVLKKLITALGK